MSVHDLEQRLAYRDTCRDAHPDEWGTLCTRRAGHRGLQHWNDRTGARWSTHVDVYATGVLSDLLAIGRCLTPGYLREQPWPTWWPRHPDATRLLPLEGSWRLKALRHRLGTLRRNVRRRKAWHGYHAEPTKMPPELERIGTGWTRRRALASLHRELAR